MTTNTYFIRYVYKISPRDTDVDTVELSPNAFSNKNTLAKALRNAGKLVSGAQIREMRVEGDTVACFPNATGHWHCIILTVAS